MPLRPQLSMYMAMLERCFGMDDQTSDRISWHVAAMHLGNPPPGEGVDWTTERPMVSTSSEPVTAGWRC